MDLGLVTEECSVYGVMQGMIMNVARLASIVKWRRGHNTVRRLALLLTWHPSHVLESGIHLFGNSASCALARARLRQAAVTVNLHDVSVIETIRVLT